MRIGWLSDIHLNFLDDPGVDEFLHVLASRPVDAWLLGGDIGEADSVATYLRRFDSSLPCMTYFTLGNHDYYGSSLAAVRQVVRALVKESRHLVWLTEAEPQLLGGDIAVVGDDAWADARCGNSLDTPVELNDFYLIEDLQGLPRAELVRKLGRLGSAAASRLAPRLERAAQARRRVVVLTHVPPFRKAAWHKGQPSDDDWVPWFSCRTVGQAILDCAQAHPEVSFLVLCGHTHSSGTYSPLPNVAVHTAQAEYGRPGVQGVFEVDANTPPGEWPLRPDGRLR